ncbi:MAG TPA: hypothetical protein VNX29_01870 [Kaistia sp.]|nr:hypothetical protein [Kaistia sp.]
MADRPLRRWCAVIEFPGKAPIMFGTEFVRHGAPDREVEDALRAAITEHLPDGWNLVNMIPGAIFFTAEDDAHG